MRTQIEIRQEITARIIEALSNGKLPPWRRPWQMDNNCGAHTNAVSQKRYTGVNPLLLQIAAARHNFSSKWWATFRQWKELGGSVMKRPANVPEGQWGTSIVYCAPVTKKEADEDGDESESTFFMLKWYTVFNVDQVEGKCLDHLRFGNAPLNDHQIEERFLHAEKIVAATGADIRHGGSRAFCALEDNFIQMPHRHLFDKPEFYYETLAHELVHWTEPPCRLNWDRANEGYAMGELIAEIGGCYLTTEFGLPTSDDLTQHCSYLKTWLKGMEDPSFIFKASAQANRAVDFILAFSRKHEPEQEPALA
ncbi:MAG TPA: ArdC-like ssDNA-binding domain-containing protein [Gemmataceae bacterium]|nr:ArdC-like ssDNA-binding domain-containing protein [Gemmataceae bacterium]